MERRRLTQAEEEGVEALEEDGFFKEQTCLLWKGSVSS